MKIGKRLLFTFLLVAIISSISGIAGFITLSTMTGQYGSALTNYGFAQGDLGLFNTEFNNSQILLRDMIINTDAKDINSYSEQLDASITRFNEYLVKLKPEMITQKEQQYYNEIVKYRSHFASSEKNVAQLAQQNMKNEAYEQLQYDIAPISTKIKTDINALINEKTTNGNQLSARLAAQSAATKGIVIGSILISLLVSVLIAFSISRSLSRPVEEMAQAARRMADGDLSVQITNDSENEIGQLGRAFSETIASIRSYIEDIHSGLAKMEQGDFTVTSDLEYKGDFIELRNSISGIVRSLNEVMLHISQAAEQVATGSSQVSTGSQALAQGATEQAGSVEELSATVSDISGHVKETSEHAVGASERVDHVSAEIETCNQHMEEMVREMSQIQDSSHQIAKIIKTIEDIAFQTNILALNAAVEAARAGTAGKGFAVVADEVRNLAGKSSEAVKDTTALIQNSIREVENGSRIVDETADSLLKVVKSAKAVSEIVEKISAASQKQSEAIVQVNLGIDQISSVVQNNSATAEQSAAASEELSGQAQMLRDLVSRFKLKPVQTEGHEEAAQAPSEKANPEPEPETEGETGKVSSAEAG